MKYNYNLNNRALSAIKNGTKKVEIRANTHGNDFSKIVKGDLICFTSDDNNSIMCRVLENNHYDTLEELFILEGTRYTTSSTNDYNTAIERINNLSGYREEIPKTGAYAIHIEYLYNVDNVWEELYNIACDLLNPREVSSSMEAGGVATAILTKNSNIYTGVCIDTACTLGMCAERNAASSMLTHGDNEIEKIVCVGRNKNIMMPCGACREFLMQLGNKNVEILADLDKKEIVTLSSLMPNWWN